jgi:hypothetical protein
MQFFRKVFVIFSLLLVIGVPVLALWKAILLGICSVIVMSGRAKVGLAGIAWCAGIVLTVCFVKASVPRVDIAEAHNVFVYINPGEKLEQGIPSTIFNSWKAQFDALYNSPVSSSESRGQWRNSGGPKTLYTSSTDAIWREPKYTRQIDDIKFRTLAEFRGGFSNEIQYNFWSGDLRREAMPFYTMYELSPGSVGGHFSWIGQVFWEKNAGSFEEIIHSELASKQVHTDDVGKRIYAAFFPSYEKLNQRVPDLYFEFTPSLKYRILRWMHDLLGCIGAILILSVTLSPRWEQTLKAITLFSIGLLFIVSFSAVSIGQYLGLAYPPHGGGDDGLAHDNWGREMALLVGQGNLLEALKGGEAVYWFTPGTRYVRMIEHLIFGDTNLLYLLLIASTPIVIYKLVQHLSYETAAWMITGAFFALIIGNFSFLQYVVNAKLGYGDAIGATFFLLGVALLMRAEPSWGGKRANYSVMWLAGAILAVSMFIRPNFSLAVIWLGAVVCYLRWRERDYRTITFLVAGLGMALWMPFHNWYYGGEMYLISKSGGTVSLRLNVLDYFIAVTDFYQGNWATGGSLDKVSVQLAGWLFGPSYLPTDMLRPLMTPMQYLKVIALLFSLSVALYTLLKKSFFQTRIAVIAVTAIMAHVPMLFVFNPHYRYAMLGWDLCLLVLFISFANWYAGLRK